LPFGNLINLTAMEKNFSNFFKGLTIYSIIILAIGALLFATLFKAFFLPVFPFLLLFYYISTLALHRYMLKIAKSDVSKFSFKFMMLSFLKMFIYIIFGVLYIVIDEESAVVFLMVYLALYVAYAVYEVRSVMKLINDSQV
jgi:hypothetical protein